METGQDKNIQKRDLPPYLSQNIAIKDCTLLHLNTSISLVFMGLIFYFSIIQRLAMFLCGNMLHWSMFWPIS